MTKMKKVTRTKHLSLLLLLFVTLLSLGIVGTITGSPKISAASGNPEYIGAEQCATCHADQYETWKETGHANAAAQINETHYWVGNPFVIRNATVFASECARCHATGYDSDTQTWFDLNIQCEKCHGADTMSLPEEQRIDYSASLCGQCHAQYGDWQLSAHNESLTNLLASEHATEECLRCHSAQAFLADFDFSTHVEDVSGEISVTNPNLEPNTCALCHNPHSAEYEHQLRFEDSTELCSKCHSSPPYVTTYDLWKTGPYAKAGLECADCHGQGTRLFHGEVEEWFNHTLWIYHTFYPYDQAEPMVCSKCHDIAWATAQLNAIQGLTTESITNVTQAIDEANKAIEAANQTSGVDKTKVNQAADMVKTAESNVNFVKNDHSNGFHNPEQAFTLLMDATRLSNAAEALAQGARAEALGTSVTELEGKKAELEGKVAGLESRVTELERSVAELALNPYIYLGGGIVLGLAIGALVMYAIRRKP